MVAGAVRGVLVLGPPDAGPFEPIATWPAGELPDARLTQVAELAMARREGVSVPEAGRIAAAVPVLLDEQICGVAALEAASREPPEKILEQLRWGLPGIEAEIRRRQSSDEAATRERLIATLDLVASALAEDGFASAAQAVATDLALRLDCDRVSVGFVENGHARVRAVSHSAEFGERMNLIRAIGLAMDEALDQRSVVAVPAAPEDALVVREHSALARQFGSDSILTVPFSIAAAGGGTATRGAFTFERPSGRPFDPASIELCQAAVAVCGRILEAKRLNERPLALRVKDAARAELERFLGPRHFGRKFAALALMAAAIFFSFATGTWRIGANATLEGSVRRVLVAPVDGYVASSVRRAGDVVEAGAVLATLDDRDLRLEFYKWESQRSQYVKQYREAEARHDRAQASIVLSQVQQAEAQMRLLGEQLGRTGIVAPFAGLVVSGDLSQSLGAAVKRGQVLFEVSPLHAFRVVLEVDEGEITGVRAGQRGQLLLTALPGEEFPLAVTSVTPIAAAREGRSFFRVEALLDRASERLRPGMEGVAKIEAGERKLAWIWTHKLLDWLRLTLWSWL